MAVAGPWIILADAVIPIVIIIKHFLVPSIFTIIIISSSGSLSIPTGGIRSIDSKVACIFTKIPYFLNGTITILVTDTCC